MAETRQETGGGAEPLTLTIKEHAVLHAVYMPYLERGGLFVPTTRTFRLREPVHLEVRLPEEATPLLVTGQVAWITPPHAPGHKAQGVGIQFGATEAGAHLRKKIEGLLAATPPASTVSHTM